MFERHPSQCLARRSTQSRTSGERPETDSRPWGEGRYDDGYVRKLLLVQVAPDISSCVSTSLGRAIHSGRLSTWNGKKAPNGSVVGAHGERQLKDGAMGHARGRP